MKMVLLCTALCMNISAQAAVLNSGLDSRHQDSIVKAVSEQCFLSGDLKMLGKKELIVAIDQGVRDVYYEMKFETSDTYDQVISDNYVVTVNSVKWDQYDHENKDWGSYSVTSVQCVRAN